MEYDRKTVNLKPRASAALEHTTARMQESDTEAINAALLLRDRITEHVDGGGVVLLGDAHGGDLVMVMIL